MKYYIQRQLSEYGPYTLADLQQYVAQGNILLTDLARSEGITEWVPVSQVLGNIPVPLAVAAAPGSTNSYGAAAAPALDPAMFQNPPNFHWAGVLVLSLLTRSLFTYIWLIVQANWVRKVTNETKDIFLAGGALAGFIVGTALVATTDESEAMPLYILGLVLVIGSYVLNLVATFSIRRSIEDHYTNVEPMNLSLSGVMTFFFSATYFQYHFNQINSAKKTSNLGLM